MNAKAKKKNAPKDGELSRRGLLLLRLLVDGKSSKQISRSTGYHEGTVRVYLHELYKRLGVRSKTQAAVKALREGLAQ